jgi:hypothetical protein
MAHREFTDEHGVRWEVWDVRPTHVERRRQQLASPLARGERRRAEAGPRMKVRDEFVQGWLAFQCRASRRRLAPVPPGWEELDEAALASLCARATPIGAPRRLAE